ncbi:hypothetical protein F4781DRAFT_139866 [Annulohypoxylon bovei var. microspora]|nr:hypothetical protein F4781DRAFT_139866 [Annulohypoxylon bovei var. microspora]
MPIIQPKPRRVGLSVNQKPNRLLSQIGGQDARVNAKNQAPAPKMGRTVKAREPVSIDAPPESSSDDEEDYHQLRDSGDDGNESRRGDIKPTTFNSSKPLPSQTSNTRSTREKPKPLSQGRKVIRNSQTDEPSSSAGSKRSAEDLVPETGSHLINQFGFTTSKKNKPSTRRPTTYGGASSQTRSSQQKSSQKSAPRSSATRPNLSPPRQTFKTYGNNTSPECVRSPPAKGFIKHDSPSPEKIRPAKAFKLPSSIGSSPSQTRPIFRHGSLLSDESPAKSKIKLFDADDGSDAAVEAKSSRQPKKKVLRSKAKKAKTRQRSPEPASKESAQRPAFKLHALDELDYLDDSDDKLAATFEDNDSDDEVGDISIDDPVAATAKCPMCHEAVDAELLAKYSDHGRMNIKKQTAFCRLHKRQTALSSRSQKGYPKINWRTLDTRLKAHQDFLKDVLEGTQESYYRDILRENVESGKNRTLLKTEDSLTPGYYGPRGLRAMTEYIMRTLSSVVRKRAVEDRLVSARGYTGYVQAVLVPELTVRLIMEDMGATEEDARKIMQDSIEVGELLYEDVGDVIAGVSDEEE